MTPSPDALRMVPSALARRLRSRLVGSTTIMTAGMGMRLLLQMLAFVIVAGSMGAAQFGAFASVAALVGIAAAFAGCGADQLTIRRAARQASDLPQAMGSGMVFLGLTAPPLIGAACLLAPLIKSAAIPWSLVLLVSLSDIAYARLNTFAAACFQSVERPIGTLWLNIGFSGSRVVAAVLWVSLAPSHDAMSWSRFYLGASALAAALSLWRLWRELGSPVWQVAWAEWRDGFHFALQLASYQAFGNIDKPLIAALSSLHTAGLYAAGSRIADAALVPVRALVYSTYPRFFRVGVSGPRESARLAVSLLPIAVGLGALGGIGIVAMAPLAPLLLGHSYVGTHSIMLVLVPLPTLYALSCLGADVLVSSGHTALRTVTQVAMPPLNALLCFLLVPSGGALGAAAAAVLTQVALASACWAAVAFICRRAAAPAGGPSASFEPSDARCDAGLPANGTANRGLLTLGR